MLILFKKSTGTVVSLPAFNFGVEVGPGSCIQTIVPESRADQTGFLHVEVGPGSCIQTIVLPDMNIWLSINSEDILLFDTGSAIVRYFCVLTGAADGETDLTLPMSSFQARRRSGNPTYLSVVIPTVDYADEMAARPNGTLKIQQAYEQNSVIKQTETIIETDLDEVNLDEGGENQSVSLVGYSTSTYSAKSVTLSGVIYKNTRGGKYHYRLAKPYVFLNPGDTVTFSDDGVTFEIDTMSYFINPTASVIELGST